jgi:hypothetical protein
MLTVPFTQVFDQPERESDSCATLVRSHRR